MGSISIPADVSEASWSGSKGKFSGKFNPQGKFIIADASKIRNNPEFWNDTDPMFAGRLFVGFNVGDHPKYTMEDLTRIVKRVRIEQVGKGDHSILYQKGVYTSRREGQGPVTEQGGQVIILNLAEYIKPGDHDPKGSFRAQLVALADTIIVEMEQEEVIIEIQKDGNRVETIGVMSEARIEEEKAKEAAKKVMSDIQF